MMQCEAFIARLEQIVDIVEAEHELETFRCDPPAAVKGALPDAMRTFFQTCSARVEIVYRLTEPLNAPFEEVFGGEFRLDARALPELENYLSAWLQSNRPAFDAGDYFPIMSVPNGDVIVLEKPTSYIRYFSHEDEEEDRVLAPDFGSFLAFCAAIGFIGNEEWQYAPFLEDAAWIDVIDERLWR